MRIKNRIGLGEKESLDKWIERELRVESWELRVESSYLA
jgi:hypothetical protein